MKFFNFKLKNLFCFGKIVVPFSNIMFRAKFFKRNPFITHKNLIKGGFTGGEFYDPNTDSSSEDFGSQNIL